MKYSEEFKEEVVSAYKAGKSQKEICNLYGIDNSLLYKWMVNSVYKCDKPNAKAVWDLKCKLFTAQQELEIWQKCESCRLSPLKARYKDIERLEERYGVHAVCRVLDVSRGSYYNHKLRSPKKTQLAKQDEILSPVVKAYFEKTKGMIGSRKIRAMMMDDGYTIDTRHIRRLMNEMGLVCASRQKAVHNTEPPKQQYFRNRLKQKFDIDTPNTVWASDTTYLYVDYEPYFLTVIIDLFSRKVVGYDVVDSISAFPLINIFKKTFAERGKPQNLLFHSDQGTQYTAYRFRVLLRGYKVIQSFSAPANPRDNAVVESFFRNIKTELIYRNTFKTPKEMKLAIDEYIVFYNSVRPHSKLGNKTPDKVEKEYFESLN